MWVGGVSRLLMTYLMILDLQSLSVLGLGSPNRLSHRIAAGHTEQRRNFGVTQSGVIALIIRGNLELSS
jgi:hypothetical protein